MLKLVGGGGGQHWACSVAGTGLGGKEAAFEVALPGDQEEAGCGVPGWGSAGIPDSAPGAVMLPAGAAGRARGGQSAEERGEPVGEGEERRARHPPAPALRLLNRKPQGGSGEIKTPENDLQRGRLSRGPRAAAPPPGMGDRGGRPEHSATHAPGAPADTGAAAVNGLLHNGFHPPPVQPPRLCSRGPAGGGDAAPPRLPLLPELQPQPPPPQHDSPAKKCRLRRRMDSGRKNRPRKSHREGSAGARQAHPAGPAPGSGGAGTAASPVRLSTRCRGSVRRGLPGLIFSPGAPRSLPEPHSCLLQSVEWAD